jgi:glycosyltransferase involved in cell wall biosynthesis
VLASYLREVSHPPGNRDVCVVVPMYNEASSVGDVVRDLRWSFSKVVCVDDGSGDDCARVAAEAGAVVVRHPVNLGQGAALQTGFTYALTDPEVGYLVTFDSDGQHRRVDAEAMVRTARGEGVDVVLGSRFLTPSEVHVPPLRRMVLRAATAFTRATTGLDLTDTHNGLRVLSRRAVEVMDLTLDGMAHASQLLSRIAQHRLSYVEAPVTIQYTDYSRARGQSNVNALNIAFDLALERLRGAG